MTVCQSAPPASRPAPRLTARSMLSLGTEDFFAFWIASYRVGLPAGSEPPVRAATSTYLISFASSLPRRASITAFLCLVVAHFEWPDIDRSSTALSTRALSARRAAPVRRRGPSLRRTRAPGYRRSAPGGMRSPAGHLDEPQRSYRRPARRRPKRAAPPAARATPPTGPG